MGWGCTAHAAAAAGSPHFCRVLTSASRVPQTFLWDVCLRVNDARRKSIPWKCATNLKKLSTAALLKMGCGPLRIAGPQGVLTCEHPPPPPSRLFLPLSFGWLLSLLGWDDEGPFAVQKTSISPFNWDYFTASRYHYATENPSSKLW